MPRFTLRLDTPRGQRFMEWSTVVDAPVTWGVPLREYKRYYKERYGSDGMKHLATVLADIERTGAATAFGETAEQAVLCNRAGRGETGLTLQQIIEHWCSNERDDSKRPTGERP